MTANKHILFAHAKNVSVLARALCVDKTGMGDAVADELETIRVGSVNGVFFTEAEKENMLNRLKLLMKKKLLKIPGDDRQLITQINEQQY